MSRLQDYEVVQIMGTGSFGTCFKVKNKLTQKLFVWKAVDCGSMSEEKRQQVTTELNLLKQFNHPHIVQYFNHIVNKETDTLYIIMECCDGGDLAQWIIRCKKERCHFEEEFIWRSLYQISKAIQGCHSHKRKITVLHRDIKPANVFLDGIGNIKIGDYGLAALSVNDEKALSTSFYMSIEEIKNTKHKQKSDLWLLGCLIYEMCNLSPPARGKRADAGSQEGGHAHTIPKLYSVDMQKMIDFMLAVDHGYRPTVEVILHHPTVLTNLLQTKSCMPLLVPDSSPPDFTLPPDLTIPKVEHELGESNTTNALRQLFTSSPKRKLQSHLSGCSSEPEQTESKRSTPVTFKAASDFMTRKYNKPEEIAKEVFNQAFKLRLQAIKDRESDLSERERAMKEREQMLMRREKHVRARPVSRTKQRRTSVVASAKEVDAGEQKLAAARRVNLHDVSYISIDTNDVQLGPTMAKMNPDRLYRPKTLDKRVSFHRPTIQFQNYNIENVPPTKPKATNDTKAKRSSSVGRVKANPQTEPDKRKSFFRIFSLNLNHLKKGSKSTVPAESKNKKPEREVAVDDAEQEDPRVKEALSNKWTAETKRTAFEMLAIMNAADVIDDSQNSTVVESMVINNNIVRHDRKRQSMIVLRR